MRACDGVRHESGGRGASGDSCAHAIGERARIAMRRRSSCPSSGKHSPLRSPATRGPQGATVPRAEVLAFLPPGGSRRAFPTRAGSVRFGGGRRLCRCSSAEEHSVAIREAEGATPSTCSARSDRASCLVKLLGGCPAVDGMGRVRFPYGAPRALGHAHARVVERKTPLAQNQLLHRGREGSTPSSCTRGE